MNFERFVARRYLRARRKQMMISFITLISILGVMTGVAALIIILSLYAGMSQDLQQRILGATSHMTVISTQAGGLRTYPQLAERLRRLPEVTHVAPAIYVQALVTAGGASTGIVLKGIDPSAEQRALAGVVARKAGRLADLETGRAIFLGAELARRLGARPGAAVTVVVPKGTLTPLGIVPRVHRFRVAGMFETGLFDVDNGWAFVSLAEGQRLAGLPEGSVQALELRVRDIYGVEALQARLAGELGSEVSVTNWIDQNRPLFAALKLEKWGMFLAIGLIVLVAALNIVTTLVMMVMEKNRDIAILRAMGAGRRQIMGIFIWQGLFIGLVGTLLGDLLGIGLSLACDHYQWIRLDAQVYSLPYLSFRVGWLDVLTVSAVALLVSFLATLYPSRQGARIDPVEAIRYE